MKIKIFFTLLCILIIPSFVLGKSFDNHTPPDLMRDFNILRNKLKTSPRDVPTLNSLGIIYAKAGKVHEAIKIWEYALRIDSSYIHLYNNLGSALKQIGNKDKARLIFKTGLAISSSYWIYYNLGLLEKEDGNYPAAVENFKLCLKHKPGFKPALKKLNQMGYYTPLPRFDRSTTPLTFGSYKPPIVMGNIGLEPLYPTGVKPAPAKRKSIASKWKKKQVAFVGKPLSLASCTALIASFKAKPKDKYIALTFDDGPHHTYTAKLLDIMKQENVKATFFVVGARAETYPQLISRMSAEGHDIGNHSWKHKSLAKLSNQNALASLKKTNEIITGYTSKPCLFVRPPFGHTNKRIKKLIHSQGWHQVMWDSDSRDWELKSPAKVLYKVMNSVTPGSIILFHDIHPNAQQILPTLIKAFKANGYRFVTMTEMLKIANSTS